MDCYKDINCKENCKNYILKVCGKNEHKKLFFEVIRIANLIRNDLKVITHESVRKELISNNISISFEKYVYMFLKAVLKKYGYFDIYTDIEEIKNSLKILN